MSRADRVAVRDAAREIEVLAALLAEVVHLAEDRAVFPGRWAHIAELAREHQTVRRACGGREQAMSCCADDPGQPGSSHSRLKKQAVVTSQGTTRLRAHVDGQDQTIRSRPPRVWARPRLLSVEQVIERIEDLRSLIPERVPGDG